MKATSLDTLVSSTQFGPDTFTYVVTDGCGGFNTANESVNQEDSLQIGMSDEWQDYYFLEINVDPDDDPADDGIPNVAKYQLHEDPFVVDTSLNLPSVSGSLSGTVTLQLPISSSVDDSISCWGCLLIR